MEKRDIIEDGFGLRWSEVEALCKKYGFLERMIEYDSTFYSSPHDKIKSLLFTYPCNYLDIKGGFVDDTLEIAELVKFLQTAKDVELTGMVRYAHGADRLKCKISSNILKQELVRFLCCRLYEKGGFERTTDTSFAFPEYSSWEDFPIYSDEDLDAMIEFGKGMKEFERPKQANAALGRAAGWILYNMERADVFNGETLTKRYCFIYDFFTMLKKVPGNSDKEWKARTVRNWLNAFQKTLKPQK